MSSKLTYEELEEKIVSLTNNLKDREQFIQTINVAGEAISIISEKHLILYTNAALDNLFGYEKGELIGENVSVLNERSSDRSVENEIVDSLNKTGIWKGEVANVKKDGAEFISLCTITLNTNENGEVINIVSAQHEITKQKIAEAALHESEERFRMIAEKSEDIIHLNDLNGNIIFANKASEKLLGYSSDEILSNSALKLVHPDDHKKVGITMEKSLVGEAGLAEIRLVKKDGTLLDAEVNGFRICDNETIKYVGAIIRDISERKRLELERYRIETIALAHAKLASLGEIAVGLAHEINQPLSFIRVIYEAALKDIGKGELNQEELQVDFAEALRQVARITSIIDHLRTFGRSDSKEFNNVNLGSVLDEALILLSEKIRLSDITLKKNISDDLNDIYGNSGQLEQIFINLVQNSMDALEGISDGVINVSMRNEKDTVVVCFSDDGVGVTRGLLDKIFEPFFSTKEVGKGTGLGLSVIYGIVEYHNGTIICESKPDQGATFHISFPQAETP